MTDSPKAADSAPSNATSASTPPTLWQRGAKASFWIVLMFCMIGMFTVLFDVHYTRPFYHETIATILLVVLVFHVVRNRVFFSMVGRKNFPSTAGSPTLPHYANKQFLLSDIVNIFLFACAIVCFITGMMISKFVFKELMVATFNFTPEQQRTIRAFHAMSSYLLLIAIGLHAGLHLHTLFNFLTETLGKLWTRVVQVSLAIMGVHGLMCIFAYNFVSKFQLKISRSIGTLNPDLPEVFYWCDLLCIGTFFAMVSYALCLVFTKQYLAAKPE